MSEQNELILLEEIKELNAANQELATVLRRQDMDNIPEEGYMWLIDEEVRLRQYIKDLEIAVNRMSRS